MKILKTLALTALLVAPAYPKAKGHLYRLDTHEILLFEFTRALFTGHGQIWMTLPSQERLTGEYSVVRDGGSSWGSVYASAYSGSGIASAYGNGSGSWSSATAQGTAILTGGNNRMMTCEFIVNSVHGNGGCRDQDGNLYKLIF